MISGKIIQPNNALPLFASKVYLSSAQILALNTTVVTVVPAQPGMMIHAYLAHWYREVGAAYTLNGATGLALRLVDSSGSICLHTFDAATLTVTTGDCRVSNGPSGSVGTTQLATVNPTILHLGQPLVAHITGGQPTGGTGGVYVTVFYHLFPMIYNNIS